MAISWFSRVKEFKSPLAVVAAILLRSRESKAAKCQELQEKNAELERQCERQARELQQKEQELAEAKRQIEILKMQQFSASEKSATVLPEDPPVGRHGYGPRMITLSVNLARFVGLRGAARVLKCIFEWLGIQQSTPHWTAIRNWLGRLGVAELQKPVERADDWIVMTDHSNQIGPEKALVMLGVRASQLPPPGKALTHEDVRVLVVKPGTKWKREDMAKIYLDFADQNGVPRAVLSDGAVELQEGADCLKERRSDTIVLRDFKHYAANCLKSLLENDEGFKQFNTQVGQTRSAIQQTELAHLTPPSFKTKARFMNLEPMLRWAGAASWFLEHPEAKSRGEVTEKRLEEKLGWLRGFRDQLPIWQECQRVISSSLTFINEQGLYRGASTALRNTIATSLVHETGKRLAERLIEFVHEAEQLLKEGERLPMSTEILESSFSLYKQLERQHSKGGFTSLLASFAALLKPTTPQAVKDAFGRVSTKDVKKWVAENLGTTLTSRRTQLFAEYTKATKSRATIQPAMT